MRTIILVGVIFLVTSACGLVLRPQIPLQKMPAASSNHFKWTMKNGVFRFGEQGPDHWRVETRLPNGRVFVKYTYRAPDGQVIENSFTRGPSEEETINRDVSVAKAISQDDFPSSHRENNDGGKTEDEMALMRYGAFSNRYQKDELEENNILDPVIQAVVISLN